MRGRFGGWASFSRGPKDEQQNSSSFDILVLRSGGTNMNFNEKPTEKWKLRGLKLRGFSQNQKSTPDQINEYEKSQAVSKKEFTACYQS